MEENSTSDAVMPMPAIVSALDICLVQTASYLKHEY